MEAPQRAQRTSPPKRTLPLRFALGLQNFLLRRNWMGAAGDYLMVITTTGRLTGRRYSVPISYLQAGDSIYALNTRGISNWYRNVRANGEALLEIKGEKIAAQAEIITDPEESRLILDCYRSQPGLFKRLMGTEPDASDEEIGRVLARVCFVRFTPA